MSNLTKKMQVIADKQVELAYDQAAVSMDALMSDLGPKVSLVDKRITIVEPINPEEAISILSRLRGETEVGSVKLCQINLMLGDFAQEYASQLKIPMARAANELADVFDMKPKRVLRLMNTSDRTPECIRDVTGVDYTLLQNLADMPRSNDEETTAKLLEAKVEIVKGVSEHGNDMAWAKSKINSVRKALGIDEEKKKEGPTLLDLLMQYYNVKKLGDNVDPQSLTLFGVPLDEYQSQLRSMEASIENLASSRKFDLWFNMEHPPFKSSVMSDGMDDINDTLNAIG